MTGYVGQTPDTVIREFDWMAEGSCAGKEPEIFADERHAPSAKKICVECPVLMPCRRWALRVESGKPVDSREGVMGGLDPHERFMLDPIAVERAREAEERRRAAAKEPKAPRAPRPVPPPAPCGTQKGYRRHIRLGEEVDEPCAAAHREHIAAERRERQNKAVRAVWALGASDQQIRKHLGISLVLVRRVRDRLGLIENTGRRP